MADYAPNFTPRYKLKYFANGKVHTQLWRPPAGAVIGDMATFALFVSGYYAAVAPLLYDDTAPLSASFAAENTDVFLPCAVPTIIGTGDTGPAPARRTPASVSFTGRSTAGQRWVLFQYGTTAIAVDGSNTGDFRQSSAELTTVLDVVGFLNGESGTFRASDGVAVLVNPYMNIKDNDYWVRKARG